MAEKGMLAAIYARQSKGSAKSVKQQIEAAQKACDRHGWTVYDTYRDLISASRTARIQRQGWAQLLADMEAGEFGVIVLWEASRGDRTLVTWSALLETCRRRRIRIHVVDDDRTYDPATSTSDWHTLAQSGVASQHESEKIGDRIRRDVEANANAGRPHGGILYGYKRIYGVEDGRKVLLRQEPHPQEAPIVREVITRIAGGEAVSAIAADLDKRGIRPARGEAWNRSSIRKMAMNRAYQGERHYNGKWLPSTPTWFPQLIDPDIALTARELLEARTSVTARPGRTKNLLSYLARCGECGSLMHLARRSSGTKSYMAYRCHQRGCCSIRQDWLDAYVAGHVCGRLDTDAFWDELEHGDNQEARQARAEEAELRQRLADYQEDAATGAISKETVAGIDKKIRALITEAQRKGKRATTSPLLAMDIDRSKGTAGLRTWFKGKPMPVQREIVQQLYLGVFVFPAGLARSVPDAQRVWMVPRKKGYDERN